MAAAEPAQGPGDVSRGAAERLMFFSDAVVAIAITLLAVGLPVPQGSTDRALLASLAGDAFAYLTFLIGFLVVGSHWRAHHRVFRYLGAVDRRFVQLSFGWLLLIVLTPFLTQVIREGELGLVRFGLFALAQGCQLVVFGAMQAYAARARLFVPGTPDGIAARTWPRSLIGAAGFLVSIPLYPVLGAWAFALWALVPNGAHLARVLSRRYGRSARG